MKGIPYSIDASLDFVTLRDRIEGREKRLHYRLADLIGKTESGNNADANVNVLILVAADKDDRPFSELFIIPDGQSKGDATKDPTVKTWLSQHAGQRIVCEGNVYISNSLTWVAVLGNPEDATTANESLKSSGPAAKTAADPKAGGDSVKSPEVRSGKLSNADYERAAKELGAGIEVALVRAVAEVESGGKSGFGSNSLPIIAFEGHWFRKYTNEKYDKDYPILSYKYKEKAGAEWKQNNPKNDAARWKTLDEAMALDKDAALKACSWGMFQVMGFNYKKCGYKTLDKFVDAMKQGESGQLSAFVNFCKNTTGMCDAMKNHDYAMIATLYNGSDYGDYDKKFQTAYEKYANAS